MKIPNVACKISAYCPIYPSEDPKKIEQAISNTLVDMNIRIGKDSLTATSTNLESLLRIYEIIHSRKTQKAYQRHLKNNLVDNSTWFYLNKQAAFAKTIALCDDNEESPLGPIKVILRSNNVERIIEWLVLDSG